MCQTGKKKKKNITIWKMKILTPANRCSNIVQNKNKIITAALTDGGGCQFKYVNLFGEMQEAHQNLNKENKRRSLQKNLKT